MIEKLEEFVALTDPKLSIYTGEELDMNAMEERPQHKITYFRYFILQYVIQQLDVVKLVLCYNVSVLIMYCFIVCKQYISRKYKKWKTI